jgi:hypothetical protein
MGGAEDHSVENRPVRGRLLIYTNTGNATDAAKLAVDSDLGAVFATTAKKYGDRLTAAAQAASIFRQEAPTNPILFDAARYTGAKRRLASEPWELIHKAS